MWCKDNCFSCILFHSSHFFPKSESYLYDKKRANQKKVKLLNPISTHRANLSATGAEDLLPSRVCNLPAVSCLHLFLFDADAGIDGNDLLVCG